MRVSFVLQNCFEIYKEGGVIKAWKKDSDGKPVPGMSVFHGSLLTS